MPSLSRPRDMSRSSPGLSRVLIATTTSGRFCSFASTTTTILAGASGSIKRDILDVPWDGPFRLLMTRSSSGLDGAGVIPRIISVIRLIDRKRDSTSALTQDCLVTPMSSPDMSIIATGGASAQLSVRRCPSIKPSSDPASTSCVISSAPSKAISSAFVLPRTSCSSRNLTVRSLSVSSPPIFAFAAIDDAGCEFRTKELFPMRCPSSSFVTTSRPCSSQKSPKLPTNPVKKRMSPTLRTNSGPTARWTFPVAAR
mmetsp:Transcript_18164/g.51978  ORF Transcript_18164/g.51978 Transcript_18164/m.51978 type:complete len:255 (-) Transcript_18164:82-846(-)